MDPAVTALAVAVAVLAVGCAALCCTVPLLLWRGFALERRLRATDGRVRKLDATLAELLKLAAGEAPAERNGESDARAAQRWARGGGVG